jgi:molybdenum cofactor cytidylyltransferase
MDGLLLAAGYSSRMVRFKPLLTYEGQPFVVGIARKMQRVCRRVIVVLGYQGDEVQRAFRNSSLPVEFVENPDFAQGMFTSLQAGVAALKEADWVLYHFCDQPHLSDEFYTELASKVDPACDGVQPAFHGKSGHPIVLGHLLIEAINGAASTSTLRDILQIPGLRLKRWECPFPGILDDFDTPADLPPAGSP